MTDQHDPESSSSSSQGLPWRAFDESGNAAGPPPRSPEPPDSSSPRAQEPPDPSSPRAQEPPDPSSPRAQEPPDPSSSRAQEPPDPQAAAFARGDRSDMGPPQPSTRRLVGISAATSALVAAVISALLVAPLTGDQDQGGTTDPGSDTPSGDMASVDLDDLEDLDLSSPVEAITEAVLPTVARVDVPGGAGSAVVYREDGYLLTNHHVVRDAQEIRVVLADGRRLPAEVVGSADFADLAVLRVDAENLPTVDFAEEAPTVGSLAIAIGSPFGFDATVTQGVVSAVNRSIEAEGQPLGDLVQTDAAINPGNSGGPLVNANGEVIGINTAIFSQMGANAGIGFAIPSSNAVAVAERLLEEGEIAPAFLGIRGDSLDPQDADTFDVGVAQGALVLDVVEDSPAAEAGLQEGDVIIAVDGRQIDSMTALAARIRLFEPGSAVELEFVRDGETMTTEIELVETPEDL